MTYQKSFLVIGGDSLVGRHTVDALKKRGHNVIATTRRTDSLSSDRVFLDFERCDDFCIPHGIDYVFLIAAATNYERCASDPQAQKINLELIPRLVNNLLSQNVFVTFISTNSVFGGERPWPGEDDEHDPRIPYAQQKADGERAIVENAEALGALDRLNITRLTKILHRETSPLPGWLDAWSHGKVVEPFSDLIFAPMSAQFVGNSLAILGERRVSGNLHLSGSSNVSYVDFAYAVASKLKIPSDLIRPTTATEKGISIAFKPMYSGLGMVRTTQLTGILPQPLEMVVDDIFASEIG